MLISIVTPSYNQGIYLRETIESVLGQEGDFSLDYIIVDGGSKDQSVEIIRHYERLINEGVWPVKCREIRYRWLSEKDRGQTDAIIKGFHMAKGEVLAWLNSDDTYLPGALSRTTKVFADEPALSVIYGRTHFTDVKGTIIGKYPTEPFEYKRLAMFNFICQPSVFFRKQALSEAGGLDMGLHYVMDYDLWIRMAAKFEFRYLPEYLSTYRLHEESKTISPAAALANHKEALDAVSRHYGWYPLNRVYMYCHHLLKSKMPPSLVEFNFLIVFLSLPFAFVRYITLNKGIRLDDLQMINLSNIRKLFMDWMDIYRKY
jgi:glycosyltransferase involved in cell wall biosynthesis